MLGARYLPADRVDLLVDTTDRWKSEGRYAVDLQYMPGLLDPIHHCVNDKLVMKNGVVLHGSVPH